ncbi:unnamed protein product [Mycena citricolor]|uniref:C2H2-type domain-containing protein n=1 Tax=Mycena citricolor TaxID=2018698 RepID=A0AAD2Q330_9AGAR|nr:unnamed protein product [Mycena citricolor]
MWATPLYIVLQKRNEVVFKRTVQIMISTAPWLEAKASLPSVRFRKVNTPIISKRQRKEARIGLPRFNAGARRAHKAGGTLHGQPNLSQSPQCYHQLENYRLLTAMSKSNTPKLFRLAGCRPRKLYTEPCGVKLDDGTTCNRMASTKQNMDTHQMKDHYRIRFMCRKPSCEETLSDAAAEIRHVKSRHRDEVPWLMEESGLRPKYVVRDGPTAEWVRCDAKGVRCVDSPPSSGASTPPSELAAPFHFTLPSPQSSSGTLSPTSESASVVFIPDNAQYFPVQDLFYPVASDGFQNSPYFPRVLPNMSALAPMPMYTNDPAAYCPVPNHELASYIPGPDPAFMCDFSVGLESYDDLQFHEPFFPVEEPVFTANPAHLFMQNLGHAYQTISGNW